MLKWTDETGTTSGLAVRHAVGEFRGLRATDATPADITACLKANPEAAAEVWNSLCHMQGLQQPAIQSAEARAEQAERERDEARAKLAEAERVSEARRVDLTLLRMLTRGGAGRLTTEEGAQAWAAIRELEKRVSEAEAERGGTVTLPLTVAAKAGLFTALRALDDDSPVGAAATAEDGHEVPAQNRQPVEPPSDPATGTTRREPPETAIGWSTGAVIPRDPCAHLCRYCGGGLQHHGLCRELDPQAPATRAEVEELRRMVSALEARPR